MPHIVFVTGENEYKSEQTIPLLAQKAQGETGSLATVLHDSNITDAWTPKIGERINSIPGFETILSADLIVLYLRFRQLPEDQAALLQQYIDAGKPVMAFRTSTHAFNYAPGDPLEKWNRFGAEVLGAPWIHHYGHESSTDVEILPEAAAHPILRGVEPKFHARSWLYQVKPHYPPPDAVPLLVGTSVGPSERKERQPNPVAWTRTLQTGNRVFTTTLGHPDDFSIPTFQRLAVNGILWALQGAEK